jgi:hypothetical protein
VFSLLGVVLIARPEFLFSGTIHTPPSVPSTGTDAVIVGPDPSEKGTPAERLGAVGFVPLSSCFSYCCEFFE